MRILVGTLYTLEREFEDCCAAIRRQTYTNFEHIVIRNLPNKQAHDTLYQTFQRRCGEFDLMIKVDADMVIIDDDFFEKIVALYRADPVVDHYSVKVHDFYSNTLIWGLNTYRNTVRWRIQNEGLFTDLTVDHASIRRSVHDATVLAPAARHCPNPDCFQSFHFGFHRAMKSVQPLRVFAGRRTIQWKIFRAVRAHYRENPDRRLACAVAGFEEALTGAYGDEAVSYISPVLKNLFDADFCDMPDQDIQARIRKRRRQRLAFLAFPFDYIFIFFLTRLRALRCACFANVRQSRDTS